MIYAADRWLHLLVNRMREHLLKQDIMHADETTLQVLCEPGRAAKTTSYLWLYRSGRNIHPIIIYDYQPTRAGEHPRKFDEALKALPEEKRTGSASRRGRDSSSATVSLP